MKIHPKIFNNSSILKNPKKFQKPQNLGFKTWNAWIMRHKKLTKWGKSWKSLKKPWGLRLEWDESVWEWKRESYRERDRRKWAADRTRRLYKPSVNLDRCRYREVSRQVSRKWSSTDTGIEEVSRNNPSNARTKARSIHQLSRSYREGRSFLDLS